MVAQQLRKVGNSFVVTVPKSEIERLGAKEGDYIESEHTLLEMKPVLDRKLRENIERNREGLTAVMQYLKDK